MLAKVYALLAWVFAFIVGFFSAGLVVTASWVTVEASDISTLTDANSAYLSTVFQVVQFLPYLAVMAGWFFLINKIFSIIPGTGWGWTR